MRQSVTSTLEPARRPVEQARGADAWQCTGLYIPGYELHRERNTQSMFGLTGTMGDDVGTEAALNVNTVLFREFSDRFVFGIESALAIEPGDNRDLLVSPQLRHELNGFSDTQLGVGAERGDREAAIPARIRRGWARTAACHGAGKKTNLGLCNRSKLLPS